MTTQPASAPPDWLYLVAQATQAPSGHNSQPWLFKLNPDSIEVHPDLRRSLPAVDPEHRELYVSLGCAVENLCLAATEKGYASQVTVADSGVITVALTHNPGISPDPLAAQIGLRQSNRRVYSGCLLSEHTIAQLAAAAQGEGVGFHLYPRDTPAFEAIAEFVYRGNTVQMHDAAFKTELKSWMRFNRKHQDSTLDGLSYAVFGAPNLPAFLSRPIMTMQINAATQNKNDSQRIQSASHLALFTTASDSLRERVALGRSLQRFWLTATALGVACAHLNQPNEVPRLAQEMAASLQLGAERPTVLLRLGYADKLPYSKRRPVSEVLMPS